MTEQDAEKNTIELAEQELAFSIPGEYANRFVVSLGPCGVRLSFLEKLPSSETRHPRASVLISYEDGVNLKNLLSDMLKDFEEQVEKIELEQKIKVY